MPLPLETCPTEIFEETTRGLGVAIEGLEMVDMVDLAFEAMAGSEVLENERWTNGREEGEREDRSRTGGGGRVGEKCGGPKA